MSGEELSGLLVLGADGRYELDGHTLHCGDPIEIYVGSMLRQGRWTEAVWIQGRVEHGSRSYYFFNPNGPHFPLHHGMQARVPER